jgi:hypothetical protein
MGLSPFLYAGDETAWWLTFGLTAGLGLYQALYMIRYHFFPAKVGLFINSVIMLILFLTSYLA